MRKPLSDKLAKVSPSMTLAITSKANAIKRQGIKVYSFGTGEPDFDTPQVIIDAAFLPDGIRTTLDYFEGESLVVFLDHFDTSWVRDKKEVGEILDEYDNIKAVLASGFDESIQKVEIHIANEILDAITNEKMIKVATESLEEAAALSFKYSEPGDIILHMGPLISFDRENIVNKIKIGLEDGRKRYE